MRGRRAVTKLREKVMTVVQEAMKQTGLSYFEYDADKTKNPALGVSGRTMKWSYLQGVDSRGRLYSNTGWGIRRAVEVAREIAESSSVFKENGLKLVTYTKDVGGWYQEFNTALRVVHESAVE